MAERSQGTMPSRPPKGCSSRWQVSAASPSGVKGEAHALPLLSPQGPAVDPDTSRAVPETLRLGTNFLETEESEVQVNATVETSMVSN